MVNGEIMPMHRHKRWDKLMVSSGNRRSNKPSRKADLWRANPWDLKGRQESQLEAPFHRQVQLRTEVQKEADHKHC